MVLDNRSGPRPQQHNVKTAIFGALSVWAMAFGIDQSLGLYRSETNSSFSDRRSAITFDETAKTGSVITTINIAWLSIRSVTSQALGTKYFNAKNHPAAIYEEQISHIKADHYASTGTLTLKGQTIPAEFAFDLTILDGLATMPGAIRIDRTDFCIGADDEGMLGFGVDVSLNLTAAR